MNAKFALYAIVFVFFLAVVTTGFCGSTGGNADVCDPKVIAQIQKGRSSKEDVKQLIGEPRKVERSRNGGEIWKYTHSVSAHSGRASTTTGGSGDTGRGGSGLVSRTKNCNLNVIFEKSGIVENVSESKVSGGSGFMRK